MKFVREYIEFERGINPKTALGIGQVANIPKILLQQDLKSGYGIDGLPGSIRDIKTTKDRVHIRFWYDHKIRNLETGKLISKEKYAKKLAEDSGIWNLFKNFYHAHGISYEFYYTLKDEYKGMLPQNQEYDYDNMNETLDFERGKDPKSALDIGRESLIKKEFLTYGDAADWAIRNLELITDDKYSPNDVIRKVEGHLMPMELADYLVKWADKVRLTGYTPGQRSLEDQVLQSSGLLHEIGKQMKEHGILIENLEFERGKDPRAALDIGGWRVVKEQIKDLLNLDWRQKRCIKKVEIWKSQRWFELTFEDYKKPPKIYLKNLLRESGLMKYINPIGSDSHTIPVITYGLSYKIKEEYQYMFKPYIFSVSYQWGSKDIEIHEEINENLEFERGKDPKTAMGIGRINDVVKKWDEAQMVPGAGSMNLEREGANLNIEIHISKFSSNTMIIQANIEEVLKEYINLDRIYRIESYVYFPIKKRFENLFISAYNKKYGGSSPFNESLDFERGKDPKKAMGLGLVMTTDDPNLKMWNFRDRLFSANKVANDGLWWGLVEHPDRDPFREKLIMSDVKDQPNIIKELEGYIYKWISQNESLEFERGKDPKSVLRLGKLQQIYKAMSGDNWSKDEDINDALQWSSSQGNLKDVIFLLELGADPTEDDSTAFIEALEADHYDVADLFVDRNLIDPVKLLRYFKQFQKDYPWSDHIIQYLKHRMSRDIKRNFANESINFERGKSPKEALNIGTSRMIPENWEHLKRDLSPYLIDYTFNDDYSKVYLEIESKLDPDEAITIIEGYLEAWVELEKYNKRFDNEYEDESGYDYVYQFGIKKEYRNRFRAAYRDEEMPY